MRTIVVSLLLCTAATAYAQEEEPAPAPAEAPAAEPAPPTEAAPAPPKDPKVYAQHLRTLVGAVRGKVLDKIRDKIIAKQEQSMDRVSLGLSILACAGLLLLFAPLVLARRFPGRFGLLCKYSALAAVTFFVAVNLFSAVLMLMRGTQGVLAELTNPQIKIVEAAFDTLDEKADDLAMMGPSILEPTLAQLSGDESDEPLPVVMLENVQKFKSELTVFTSVARFFKSVSWVFGYLPIVLTMVALILFVLATRPVLERIVRLPATAASGQAGIGKRVVKETFRRVSQEFLATLCTIGCLLAVTILGGTLLGAVLKPAVEAFIAYLFVAFLYVQLDAGASSFWILASLGGTILFLALNLAAILLSAGFFLGRAQKIFQQRFVQKVPLRTHGRFWKWGTLSLLWVQLFPLLYILGARPLVEWIIAKTFSPANPHWPLVMTSGPAVLVVLFVVVFWAARGLRALGFLLRYKVASPPQSAEVRRAA